MPLEPKTGFEPAYPVWKTGVLPLHHSGITFNYNNGWKAQGREIYPDMPSFSPVR